MKGQKKQQEKAIQFINFTNDDFTWKFDGIDYTVKAKQSTYFRKYQAEMFAKHLVDREMNKKKKATNLEPLRGELLKKCFGEDEIKAEGVDEIENKVDNKNKEFEELNETAK